MTMRTTPLRIHRAVSGKRDRNEELMAPAPNRSPGERCQLRRHTRLVAEVVPASDVADALAATNGRKK